MTDAASTSPPLVSVMMPAYNAGAYLREAIDSALAQDYPALEIIVVNDGSTDDTAAVMASYGDRIRAIQHEKNQGIGATRNTALRASKGEFIAPLDADDIWLPGKISAQVALMQQRPAVVLCHTGCEVFGSETGDGPITHDVRQRIDGRCFEELFKRNGIVTSTAMFRTSAVPPDGFDGALSPAEDYMMWLELLGNAEAAYLPTVTTRYRRHEEQATGDKGKRVQIKACLARLYALEQHHATIDETSMMQLYHWVLDELHTCAYSRYWSADYGTALLGFRKLVEHGRPVPVRHRMRAALAVMIGR
jgi:glycosyltransferase involved in cell wall biosynthesis